MASRLRRRSPDTGCVRGHRAVGDGGTMGATRRSGELLMARQVRAAVMVEPGRMETRTFPLPDPEPGAVVLKMELSGICGTDKHSFSGFAKQYSGTDHERTLPFPIIPGHENVGTIAAIGSREKPLTDFTGNPLAEGDRVVLGAN